MQAYARWAASYPPRSHNPLMALEETTLTGLIGPVAGCRVLDAGCGTGRYLRILIGQAADVVGVDLSAEMLARARRVTSRVLRADVRALPIGSASMDLATCGLVLGDIEDVRAGYRELARVLRPGGRLVASVVHPRGLAAGWVRSFDTPDGRWAVQTWWHPVEEHVAACAACGLAIEHIAEPSAGRDPGPVLLVLAARRSG